MGLTSALNTSLNGLALNETSIDVLGNNIANAGTNGFKSSQVLFTTQLSRTISIGSRPTETNGGTNPRQVGLGATTAAVVRDFAQGSITNSSSPSDLAIQGNGFFIVKGSEGSVYTRDGNFALNSNSELANPQGLIVQGYGIDSDFNLVTTQLAPIRVPLGDLQVAQQTKQVVMGGALSPTGTIAAQGSVLTSEALTDAATGLAATTTTLLSDVRNAGGQNLFTVGQTLSYAPVKGARTLDAQTLDVTATSSLSDLLTFYSDALGIQSGGTVPNDGVTGTQPGVTLSGGMIQVVGNAGNVNDIDITVGDMTSNGSVVSLAFTKSQEADGEGSATDFVVFDSLGQPITMRMTAVLESRDSSSTTYRYYLESADDSRSSIAISNGTINFDSVGNVMMPSDATFSVQRDNTAAVSPMQIRIDFSKISGITSQSAGSAINLVSQDGSPPGTLQSFVIDDTGVINGVFDNGIIRTLGQVTLARFANPQGLLEAGGGTYREGVSSGVPFLTTPGAFGTGTVRAGAIELSNTDIGRNLVDLIVASTNYRGNARVISSVQQLIDELLVLGR